ncbi:MAG: phage head closure protein [bacterium]|nr:phage head closure protein [bacterium]
MRIGRLRERVILAEPLEVRDSDGGVRTTYGEVASVWAAKRDVRGREYTAGREVHSTSQAEFTIRSRSDVELKWRVIHGSRSYDITSVADLGGRRAYLELSCVEVK